MSEHTNEPHFYGGTQVSTKEDLIRIFRESIEAHVGDIGQYFMEIYSEDGKRIAFLAGPTAHENARRVVACVNLLEGHDTEKIEGKTLEQYVSEQAFISEMTVQGGFNIELNGLACQMMASAFAGQFKGSGAINYLGVACNHPEIGDFTVTIQRNEGKTPHQFRIAAEQQRDELLTALEAMLYIFDRGLDDGMIGRKICDEAKAAISKVK